MTLHPKVMEILRDRRDLAQQFPRSDYDDEGWVSLQEEIRGLTEAIDTDYLNDWAVDTLEEYGVRDGYCDPKEGYLRAINRDLALAGRLEVDDGKSQYFPRKPPTCQVNGVRYFAAVSGRDW